MNANPDELRAGQLHPDFTERLGVEQARRAQEHFIQALLADYSERVERAFATLENLRPEAPQPDEWQVVLDAVRDEALVNALQLLVADQDLSEAERRLSKKR